MTVINPQVREVPTELRIVVPGEPVGKERARIVTRTKKDGTVFTKGITPPKTEAFEKKLRELAKIAVNQARWMWSDTDRFQVVMRVYRTYPNAGPDLDNIIKTMDALNGVVWKDDRYVRGIGAAIMDPDPKNPRLVIIVRRIRQGIRSTATKKVAP